MNFKFKAYKYSPYIIPTVTILVGLVLICLNRLFIAIVGLIFGLIFVSSGGVLAANSFIRSRYGLFPKLNFVFSMILILLGISCLLNPNSVAGFISHITGLIILATSLSNMNKAYVFMKYNKSAMFEFIKAIISFIVSLILIFNPVGSTQFTLIVVGFYLVYFGVVHAINIHRFQ